LVERADGGARRGGDLGHRRGVKPFLGEYAHSSRNKRVGTCLALGASRASQIPGGRPCIL
jgi:hypothetical protein